jgi:hypothetical protein
MVEHLPGKHKTLSSNPDIMKKKKERKKRKRINTIVSICLKFNLLDPILTIQKSSFLG